MAASSGGIRAGRAYIELFTDDAEFIKGLKSAQGQLKSFGKEITKIGAGLSIAGGAITAPFAAASVTFSEVGDNIAKMSQKTGISVEALSQLKYAAELSGSSLEGVATGIKFMQKNMEAARGGSKGATEAFTALGISLDQLQGLKPDEQFSLIADSISKVEDPAQKTALAMRIFGRSGAELIPLLNEGAGGLARMRTEADNLGLTLTSEGAVKAEALNDSLDRLKLTLLGATMAIGEALAPAITKYSEAAAKGIGSIIKWIAEHQELVVLVGQAGVVLLAAGTATLALGQAMQGVAATITVFTAASKLVPALLVAQQSAGYILTTQLGLLTTTYSAATLAVTAFATAGAVAAIVGISYALYKANPAIRAFNYELERAKNLSNKFAALADKRVQKTLSDASAIQAPEERKAFLGTAIDQQQKEVNGLITTLGEAQSEVDSIVAAHGSSRFGNSPLVAADAEVEEYTKKLNAARDALDQLRAAATTQQGIVASPVSAMPIVPDMAGVVEDGMGEALPEALSAQGQSMYVDEDTRKILTESRDFLKEITDNTRDMRVSFS